MNNAISEIKNTLEATNSRITEADDRISELEDRMVEINESERIKEKWMWFGAFPGAFGLGRAQPQRRGTSP